MVGRRSTGWTRSRGAGSFLLRRRSQRKNLILCRVCLLLLPLPNGELGCLSLLALISRRWHCRLLALLFPMGRSGRLRLMPAVVALLLLVLLFNCDDFSPEIS